MRGNEGELYGSPRTMSRASSPLHHPGHSPWRANLDNPLNGRVINPKVERTCRYDDVKTAIFESSLNRFSLTRIERPMV